MRSIIQTVSPREISSNAMNGGANGFVRFFWCVKRSEMNMAIIDADPSGPSFLVSIYTAITAGVLPRCIGQILRWSGKAKIFKSIVAGIAVPMVNVILRPFFESKIPSQSMAEITRAIDHNAAITPDVFAPRFATCLCFRAMVYEPPEYPRFRIIVEDFAQLLRRHWGRVHFHWHHTSPDGPNERRREVRSEVGYSVASLSRHAYYASQMNRLATGSA